MQWQIKREGKYCFNPYFNGLLIPRKINIFIAVKEASVSILILMDY